MISIDMKIKEVRTAKKVSLERLSNETGIDRKHLAEVENKNADEIILSDIVLISQALGVAIEDLFVVTKYKLV